MKTFVTVFLKWTKIVLNPWCTKQKIPAYFSYTSIFVWSWQPTFTASPVGNTHIFHIANLKSVQQQSSVQEISNKILGQILLNQIVQKSARDGLLLSCSHGRSCRSAHAGKPKLRGQCDWEAFLWHSNIFEKTSTEICKRTVYKGEMLEMWLRWRMPIRKRSQEHREFHALIASVDLHMWKKCSFSLGGAARPWPMSQWPQCGAGLYGWRRKQKGKQKEDAHGSGFFSDRNLGESWSAEWRKKKGERPAKCTFRSAARHEPNPSWHCPQGPPHPHAPPLCLGRRLGSTSSKGARGRRQKHTDEVISQVAGFLTRMALTCKIEMVNGSPLWGRAAIHLRSLHSECLRFPLGRPLERLHPDWICLIPLAFAMRTALQGEITNYTDFPSPLWDCVFLNAVSGTF